MWQLVNSHIMGKKKNMKHGNDGEKILDSENGIIVFLEREEEQKLEVLQ